MVFDSLLALIDDDPVFESSLLLAGNINPQIVLLQLNRWVNSGRIYQLRRGLYSIAPPYQKIKPHPFLIANHLQKASYVSLQSALAFYGLIPEIANTTTSVSTGRPEHLETPLGRFEFRHIKANLLFGYRTTKLGEQSALVATPEKALLDLIYLQPRGNSTAYLNGLRLQNTEQLDLVLLEKQSEKFGTPKMLNAAKEITRIVSGEASKFEDL